VSTCGLQNSAKLAKKIYGQTKGGGGGVPPPPPPPLNTPLTDILY